MGVDEFVVAVVVVAAASGWFLRVGRGRGVFVSSEAQQGEVEPSSVEH